MKDHNKKILIIKLSSIGDVVHSLPFLEVIRNEFPHALIDWIVEQEAASIIKGHPALNNLIISKRKVWQKNIFKTSQFMNVMNEAKGLIQKTRSLNYNMVIDLQGLLKSGLFTCIAKGHRKIGMAGAREGAGLFYTEQVPVNYDEHAIDRYLRITEYLGCQTFLWQGRIPVTSSDNEYINNMLGADGEPKRPIIAINPMTKWKTKLWEEDRFAVLADRLVQDLGCDLVFTGSRNDRSALDNICSMMKKDAINLAGKTSLKELACLYTRCAILITTDTGPMHIGAAMGCRIVALFGPTAPWRTGPYGQGNKIIRSSIDCSPCLKKTCDHKTCMTDISVETVFDTAKEILQDSGRFRGA